VENPFDEIRCDFIELVSSDLFSATFQGRDLHSVMVEDALPFMRKFGHYNETDVEIGSSHIFPSLEISLWRNVMPEASRKPWGGHVEAIGVGKSGCFSAQSRLEGE